MSLIWTEVNGMHLAPVNKDTTAVLFKSRGAWKLSYMERSNGDLGSPYIRLGSDLESAKHQARCIALTGKRCE